MTSIETTFNGQNHFDLEGAFHVAAVYAVIGAVVGGLLLGKLYNPSFSSSTITYSLTGQYIAGGSLGFLAGGGIGFLMKCIEHVAKQQKKPKIEIRSANFTGYEDEKQSGL